MLVALQRSHPVIRQIKPGRYTSKELIADLIGKKFATTEHTGENKNGLLKSSPRCWPEKSLWRKSLTCENTQTKGLRYVYNSPNSLARATAWVRVAASSLAKMLRTWALTV